MRPRTLPPHLGDVIDFPLSELEWADLSTGQIEREKRLAATEAIGNQRVLRLEELVDNCASLSNSSAIAGQCRLEPAEQRLRPAS